jgi:hypothetical protein
LLLAFQVVGFGEVLALDDGFGEGYFGEFLVSLVVKGEVELLVASEQEDLRDVAF